MATSRRITHFVLSAMFAFSVVLLLALVEGKVLNCRPLPQCCRKFVFSPACRGVAAKRSGVDIINEDFLRDPRIQTIIEPDYSGSDDFKSLDEDSVLRNARSEYLH